MGSGDYRYPFPGPGWGKYCKGGNRLEEEQNMETERGACVFIIIANVNEMDLDQVVCASGQETNNLLATSLVFSPLTHPAFPPLTVVTCPCSQPGVSAFQKTGASHRRATI